MEHLFDQFEDNSKFLVSLQINMWANYSNLLIKKLMYLPEEIHSLHLSLVFTINQLSVFYSNIYNK